MVQPRLGLSTSYTSATTERRRYKRFPVTQSLRITELIETPLGSPKPKTSLLGKIKNIGQGGIKISSLPPLTPRAKVLVDVDLEHFHQWVDERNLLFVHKNEDSVSKPEKHILAEVMWRQLNLKTGLFETGLRFVEAWREKDYAAYLRTSNETCA